MRAKGELTGTWEGVVTMDADGSEMSVVFELKNDGTFTERIKEPPVSFSGTYQVDQASGILSVAVTSTSNAAVVPAGAAFKQDIAIGQDGKTFKASGGGSSGVFKLR